MEVNARLRDLAVLRQIPNVQQVCEAQGRLGRHGDEKSLLPVTGIDVHPTGLLLYCVERVNKRIIN